MTWYRYSNDKLILSLYIQPGAKHSELLGLHGEALKIKLASPPMKGRANAALLEFLASQLKLPLRQIKLLRGEKSRHKVVEVTGCVSNPELTFLKR